jgi:hypothetical protein
MSRRRRPVASARAFTALAAIAASGPRLLLCLVLAGCALEMPHEAQPPRHDGNALRDAKAQVFLLADDPPEASRGAGVAACLTPEGWCALAQPSTADLRCLCEAADGSWRYAGRTGAAPAR